MITARKEYYTGYYIGTIIDPSCLPEYHINEPDFISAQEEYADKPIKINFTGWRKHVLFTTGE